LAAQQHELTLTRHYEALLLARETKTMPADPTTAANISASFQRLSRHLHGLLRALSGEEPDPLAGKSDQNENNASLDLEAFKSLLQSLEHEDTSTNDTLVQDWAHVRECEISRLEKENQELRRILDIDQKSLDEHGIIVDADAYPKISQRTSRSRSESNLGGGESWGTRPLSQTGGFTIGPGGGAEGQVLNSFGGSGNVNNGQQHQQPQHQPQQHILQRAMDVGPGMRMQGRRPAMFGTGGQRGGSTIGRGGGGGGGSSLWNSPPGPPTSAWQAQGTSSLDLSR
jgi:hypothetical protein